MIGRAWTARALALACIVASQEARADEDTPPQEATAQPATTAQPIAADATSAAATAASTQPATTTAQSTASSATTFAAATTTTDAGRRTPFVIDPIEDGGVIVIGVTFGLLSSAVIDTGEIRPQQISPDFTRQQLLGIDRGAISQTIDGNAHALSNVGLGAIGAYALVDTVLDGAVRANSSWTAALTDAVMYIEAVTITQGMTNLAKIAFRRPRPIAYMDRERAIQAGASPETYQNAETDSALSFFSGHSSQAAALSATATYIAFRRAGAKSLRPWLTLAGGAALTSFVAYERVRGGAHFPTDVIAGAVAGAAVGALVVHLHRAEPKEERPLVYGLSVAPTLRGEGGVVSFSKVF